MIIENYQLNDEQIAYSDNMAADLFSNQRTNYKNETLAHKKRQCLKGNLIEFAVMNMLPNSRHAGDEAPNYEFDIITTHADVQEAFGWSLKKEGRATIECKHMSRQDYKQEQTFITFEKERIFHAQRHIDAIDYVLVAETLNRNYKVYSGDIEILGIFASHVLSDRRYIQKSKYNDKYFLKDYPIKGHKVGKYFWK